MQIAEKNLNNIFGFLGLTLQTCFSSLFSPLCVMHNAFSSASFGI